MSIILKTAIIVHSLFVGKIEPKEVKEFKGKLESLQYFYDCLEHFHAKSCGNYLFNVSNWKIFNANQFL